MNYYNSRPLTLLSRLAEVSSTLGSLAAKLWLDKKLGDGSGWEKNMESRAKEFVEFVQGAGPAFIKIGQGVSIRPDILPEPYLKELVQLQDRVSLQSAVAYFWRICFVYFLLFVDFFFWTNLPHDTRSDGRVLFTVDSRIFVAVVRAD